MKDMPLWSVVLLIILIYIVANQTYTSYRKDIVKNSNVYCDNGNIMLKNNIMGMAEDILRGDVSLHCLDYRTSRYRLVCEGDKVYYQCEATILDQIFNHPGDWIVSNQWP
jgi:hypothetical protein